MANGERREGGEMTVFGEAAKKFSEHQKGEVGLSISPALEKSFEAWGDQDPEEILTGSKEIRGIVRERLGDLAPFLERVWFAQKADRSLEIPQHTRESTEVQVTVNEEAWRDNLKSELDKPERKVNLVIEAAVQGAMAKEGLSWIEGEIKDMEEKRPTKENIEKLGRLHVEAAEKEKIIALTDAAVKNHKDELRFFEVERMKEAVSTALFGMGSARIRRFTPRPSIFEGPAFP